VSTDSDRVTSGEDAAPPRRRSFFGTMATIPWAFFGVGKSATHKEDAHQISPVHVIVAGLIGAALFILVLVLVVKFVVASGVAQ
jgi:hypothetical protein